MKFQKSEKSLHDAKNRFALACPGPPKWLPRIKFLKKANFIQVLFFNIGWINNPQPLWSTNVPYWNALYGLLWYWPKCTLYWPCIDQNYRPCKKIRKVHLNEKTKKRRFFTNVHLIITTPYKYYQDMQMLSFKFFSFFNFCEHLTFCKKHFIKTFNLGQTTTPIFFDADFSSDNRDLVY